MRLPSDCGGEGRRTGVIPVSGWPPPERDPRRRRAQSGVPRGLEHLDANLPALPCRMWDLRRATRGLPHRMAGQ